MLCKLDLHNCKQQFHFDTISSTDCAESKIKFPVGESPSGEVDSKFVETLSLKLIKCDGDSQTYGNLFSFQSR